MMKKIFYVTILLAIAASLPAWAGDETAPESMVHQPHSGVAMSAASDKFHESAQNEIDKKNKFTPPDASGSDGAVIDYNEDGTIRSVLFADGERLGYSYEHDERGKMRTCRIDSGEVRMNFTEDRENGVVSVAIGRKQDSPATRGTAPQQDSPATGETAPQQDSPATRGTAPQVVIYYPRGTIKLEDVAKKPIKFDAAEINKTIAKVSAMKGEALNIYLNKTSRYYEKVGEELRRNINDLGLADTKLKNALEEISESNIPAPKNREAIDEAVAFIRAEAGEGRPGEAAAEFISFENGLRGRILTPGKAAYDKRIEAAVKYIDGMIDKLVNSKLALYLNIDKDKIDVVINLPALEKER